ncbi:asterix [Acrasis kona]|uniref:Asterix n=1 Tax=Acrasis kona TaxID=1008807 RepID=A0AAW2ZE44_9EUKA
MQVPLKWTKRSNPDAEKPRPKINKKDIEDDRAAEIMPMICVVSATMGMMIKIKVASWVSIFCCISYILNVKSSNVDLKQVLTSILVSAMGLFLNYFGPNSRPVPE